MRENADLNNSKYGHALGTFGCPFFLLFSLLTMTLKSPETVAQRSSVEKVFLEISQNSQEITVPESVF